MTSFENDKAETLITLTSDIVAAHVSNNNVSVDEAIAELFGDLLLQRLELRVDEFEHLAALDVDQVIVVRFRGGFVARPPITEIVTVENPCFLEQADGAVDRGDRDLRVDRRCAGVERLDVGMVLGIGQDPRDDATLLGDPQAPLCAERFEIYGLVQGEPRSIQKRPATMEAAGRFFNSGQKS